MIRQPITSCPKTAHEVTQLFTNDESSTTTPPHDHVPDNPPINEELVAEETMRQEWESFSKMRDGTVKTAMAQSFSLKNRTAFF